MPIEFTNPEVAEKYEALVDTDRNVHKMQVYSGALSKINPKMAEALAKQGRLVKEKNPKSNLPAKTFKIDPPPDK